MKKSRFTETQIVSILKQADAGMLVKDLCRQAGISLLPVEVEVWGHGRLGPEAGEGARSREQSA